MHWIPSLMSISIIKHVVLEALQHRCKVYTVPSRLLTNLTHMSNYNCSWDAARRKQTQYKSSSSNCILIFYICMHVCMYTYSLPYKLLSYMCICTWIILITKINPEMKNPDKLTKEKGATIEKATRAKYIQLNSI